MKLFRMMGIAVGVVAVCALSSYADGPANGTTVTVRPLQLALVPTIQLVPQDESIQGLRLNIYGCNQNVSGVDIGLMHETKGAFHGIGFGLVNITHDEGRGLQLSCIYSGADGQMAGLQIGIANRAKSIHGLQIGLANFADDMTGVQLGLWNEIKNKEQWNVIPIINAAF